MRPPLSKRIRRKKKPMDDFEEGNLPTKRIKALLSSYASPKKGGGVVKAFIFLFFLGALTGFLGKMFRGLLLPYFN